MKKLVAMGVAIFLTLAACGGVDDQIGAAESCSDLQQIVRDEVDPMVEPGVNDEEINDLRELVDQRAEELRDAAIEAGDQEEAELCEDAMS